MATSWCLQNETREEFDIRFTEELREELKDFNINEELEKIEKEDNNELKFWEFVKKMNWNRIRKNMDLDSLYYKALKICGGDKELLSKMEHIDDMYNTLLDDALDKYMVDNFNIHWDGWFLPVSDDGRYYLISHIVGMGEKYYMNVLKNLTKITQIARKTVYCEGWCYVFIEPEEEYDSEDI